MKADSKNNISAILDVVQIKMILEEFQKINAIEKSDIHSTVKSQLIIARDEKMKT